MHPELIKKINRYFHDEESRYFKDRHALRMGAESGFYVQIFRDILARSSGTLRMLDIGSGTGLVGSALPEGRVEFVCTDISYEMLKRARENLSSGSESRFSYVVCDSERLPFASGSFDLVTCNAAMHHFPSMTEFAGEVKRVMSPAGIFVAGFESNRKFWANRSLSLFYRMINRLAPARVDGQTLPYKTICAGVNQRLINEGAISVPMQETQIMRHVDVHSPNSGDKIDYDEGFDVSELTGDLFKGCRSEIRYHYDSLPKLVEIVNRALWPDCAPKFSLVIKKIPA